ncbi:MAG: hypothetical protein LBS28_04675 [Streptococcaceae bacterium]|jgi:intracellular sulfur oxidation DsrE/DsrF family protein|nr:hypothetical protein [Streptococcaceae bacterium]
MTIKIALIDTGVNKNIISNHHVNIKHFFLKNEKVIEKYKISNDLHGDECLKEILRQVDIPFDILDFNITDRNGNLSMKGLILSIKKAIEERADIVNISLGINNYSSLLFEVCQEAVLNNVAIISAGSHSNNISYPAEFKNVVRVIVNQKQKNKIKRIDETTVSIRLEEHIQKENGFEFDFSSTSLACAYFSGVLAKLLNDTPIFDKFILLKKNFGLQIDEASEFIKSIKPIPKKIGERIKDKKLAVVLLPPKKISEISNFLKLKNVTSYWDFKDQKFYRFGTLKEEDTTFDVIVVINTTLQEIAISDNIKKRFPNYEWIFLGKIKQMSDNLLYSHEEFKNDDLSSLEKPVLLILSLGRNSHKFEIQKNLVSNFAIDELNPKALTYNPEGVIYGFDVFYYPKQVIFPDIVGSINYYMNRVEAYEKIDVFVINVGGGISFINNQNKQTFGKLNESYLHATKVDVVVLCIHCEVNLKELEFTLQKFRNFGVKFIFLVPSYNTFDHSTLEAEDGIQTYQMDFKNYQLRFNDLKKIFKEDIFTIGEVKKNQLYQKILESLT